MSLTPEEIAEVRKALAGVPESDVRHALALMEDVPASMEVPDAIIAFYTAVGTAANALWQARASALKTALEYEQAQHKITNDMLAETIKQRDNALNLVKLADDQREEAIVERDALRAEVDTLVKENERVAGIIAKVEALLREASA